MIYNYNDFGVDDVILRNFVMPNSTLNNLDNKTNNFIMPNEGFLRGNMENNKYIPYKNMTYINPAITSEKENDLYNLQEMEFAAHDVNLYLDTHNKDLNAIKLYKEYKAKAEILKNNYERKYGPINLSDDINLNSNSWLWISEPWPWNYR